MFKLGRISKDNLIGVHPDLVAVVERAIELTTVDFRVFEGMRSREKQMEYYRKGVSRTVNSSRHLVGADGFAHAVDLVPFVKNLLLWEWDYIYPIAEAVKTAANELGIDIRWGGVWDRILNEEKDTAKKMVADYVARRRKLGKSAFIDGPHFELPVGSKYPQ